MAYCYCVRARKFGGEAAAEAAAALTDERPDLLLDRSILVLMDGPVRDELRIDL